MSGTQDTFETTIHPHACIEHNPATVCSASDTVGVVSEHIAIVVLCSCGVVWERRERGRWRTHERRGQDI